MVRPLIDDVWIETVRAFSLFGTLFGLSLRIAGQHHLPQRGPVLVVANHESFLDPVLIGVASPRHLSYLARQSLWRHRLFGRIITSLGGVPLRQESGGKEGLQEVLRELEAGRGVLIFPEGERTHDGRMQPFRPGVALLARRVAVPIVPLGLTGTFAAWPRHRVWPRLAPPFLPKTDAACAVAFGPPIHPNAVKLMTRGELLRELHHRVHEQVGVARRLHWPQKTTRPARTAPSPAGLRF